MRGEGMRDSLNAHWMGNGSQIQSAPLTAATAVTGGTLICARAQFRSLSARALTAPRYAAQDLCCFVFGALLDCFTHQRRRPTAPPRAPISTRRRPPCTAPHALSLHLPPSASYPLPSILASSSLLPPPEL